MSDQSHNRCQPGSASDVLDREEKYLLAHFASDCGLMPGDIQGSFHRISEAIRSPSVDAGAREALETVKRIEMVEFSQGYEMPAEPQWRIEINNYCADFPTETAANNFRNAILSLLTSHAQCGVHTPDAWQPIDTAPRDGTKVDLLYPYPRGRTINCEFRVGDVYGPDGGWYWDIPQWEDDELLPESEWDTCCYPNMQPTHWMLSPSLPSAQPLPDWKQDQAETSRIKPKGRDHFIAEAIADIASELPSTVRGGE